jgi:hypothetical protein
VSHAGGLALDFLFRKNEASIGRIPWNLFEFVEFEHDGSIFQFALFTLAALGLEGAKLFERFLEPAGEALAEQAERGDGLDHILPNDHEGPNVSYTFRIEAVSRATLPQALNPIDPMRFPLRNYLICSERVSDIVRRRKPDWPLTSCGLFKLKGFSG